MSKTLALFFDGTWNRRSSNTNVSVLYDLTSAHREFRGRLGKAPEEKAGGSSDPHTQFKYYHSGVGTRLGEALWGGAFGYGLSRNIKDGYLWLSQHYERGDELFIFGFSRGAYTARSLVGLIRKCGIPRTPEEAFVEEAYHIYREKQWEPDGREASAFKRTYSHHDGKVRFLGVWDTVGALGIPAHSILFSRDYYSWHDTDLSRMVENAYHALALDEHRPDFAATMWSNTKKPAPYQRVEQRWFSGAHADVGGGYPDGKLQQLPLRWMLHKARKCGLQFTGDVKIDGDPTLAPMHDSYGRFMWGLYARLSWNHPHYRPLWYGIRERIDDSVWKRVDSSEGKNERGRKYAPPALLNWKR